MQTINPAQQNIVELLMQRDGLNEDAAIDWVLEAQAMIQSAYYEGDVDAAEDVLYDMGLEPDYIWNFI